MFAAVGTVLIARLPFGREEVAHADRILIRCAAGLIGRHFLGDGFDLEVELAGTAARHPQGQTGQFDVQRALVPQTGQRQLAIGPHCAKHGRALIQRRPRRHAGQHQAVELLAAIPVGQGGADLERIIHQAGRYRRQGAVGLVELVDAVIKLHQLDVVERLADGDAVLLDQEVETAVTSALDDIVGTRAHKHGQVGTGAAIQGVATQSGYQNVVAGTAVEGVT